MSKKRQIAILGGGMSSLVTAFELTRLPDWKDKYEITIYQMGWRLGGKGASGRNKSFGNRIEEHGLHFLFGFYENAFRIIRTCYTELSDTGDADLWTESFVAFSGKVNMLDDNDDNKESWLVEYPNAPGSGTPGDGTPIDDRPLTYVKRLLDWAARQLPNDAVNSNCAVDFDSISLRNHIKDVLNGDRGTVTTSLPVLALRLANTIAHDDENSSRVDIALLTSVIDRLISTQSTPLDSSGKQIDGRHPLIWANLTYCISRGLCNDLLLQKKHWFDLDTDDLRDWLKRHGASTETVESAPVRGMYAAVFGEGYRLGAGSLLQSILRAAFTFKGAVMYKMNGGMGDVVFSPLYRVLKKRGVTFKFFHRVEELKLSEDGKSLASVTLRRQATTKSEAEYTPIFERDDEWCWPNAPDADQLNTINNSVNFESDKDKHTGELVILRCNKVPTAEVKTATDIIVDDVVLGISVGALPDIARDLISDPNNTKFGWMVRGLCTTRTQSLQLWFKTLEKFNSGCSVIVPGPEPLDTSADMSHLLDCEGWPSTSPPSGLSYHCSPLHDDDLSKGYNEGNSVELTTSQMLDRAEKWINDNSRCIWSDFEWKNLYGEDKKDTGSARELENSERLKSQYVNVPVNASDRYVLAAQGTNRYRLRANESGYAGLYLTGDWIRTALSIGCLEAATMAGIQTARAIDPRVPKATGDSLPDPSDQKPKLVNASGPSYLFLDGDLMPRPPIRLDVSVYVFLLHADKTRLTQLCKSYLNLGQQTYTPLGPFVAFYCSSINNTISSLGSAQELDFGFWVPVISSGRVLLFTPYAWVDSGWALIGGRSVFGFPKQMANLKFPSDNKADGTSDDTSGIKFSVDTLVLPIRGEQAKMRPLVTVSSSESINREKNADYSWFDYLRALDTNAKKPSTDSIPSDSPITHPFFGQVFLKQFPDEGLGDLACYRAVLEAPMTIDPSSFSAGLLSGQYTVTVNRYASHDPVNTLGLRVTPSSRSPGLEFTPFMQNWARFVATLGPASATMC